MTAKQKVKYFKSAENQNELEEIINLFPIRELRQLVLLQASLE